MCVNPNVESTMNNNVCIGCGCQNLRDHQSSGDLRKCQACWEWTAQGDARKAQEKVEPYREPSPDTISRMERAIGA